MILIGLHGRKGAGKNVASSVILDWARGRGISASEQAFANKLKLSAARLFFPNASLEWALSLADQMKQDDVQNHVELRVSVGDSAAVERVTGRQFLQHYGTEAHREVFGEDFWVDALLPRGYESPVGPKWWSSFNKDDQIATITDVRFENEAERIRELGGVVWFIDRPDAEEGDKHASEQPLPDRLIDKTILNDGTREQFRSSVATEMTIEYHMKFVDRPDSLDEYDQEPA